MIRSRIFVRLTVSAALLTAAAIAAGPSQIAAGQASTPSAEGPVETNAIAGGRSLPDVKHDASQPLAAMIANIRASRDTSTYHLRHLEGPTPPSRAPAVVDPVLQTDPGGASMPAVDLNFEGLSGRHGIAPPDANGDVGLNNFIESVNIDLAIFDKAGNMDPSSPFPANALFGGFGGPCEQTNDGDPVIQYDPLADRWVFTQFALPNYPSPPFYECFAISQTSDPTGAWYRYAFDVPGNAFPDYPKIGVWPDAYYMTINEFGSERWRGAAALAFDRTNMLAGAPATLVYFRLPKPVYGLLPSDVENASAPPTVGEPDHMVAFDWHSQDALLRYDFHVDFATPEDSTLTQFQNLPVAPFRWRLCPNFYRCIPEKGTDNLLDPVSDHLLYQLEYFNYGSHEDMVVTHAIKAGKSSGIRWYQLRSTGGGSWTLYQQGTYAPGGQFRWDPSGALDADGNFAVGYNASSRNVFPSIRMAGRLDGDPLGELAQGEKVLIFGGGSQTRGGPYRYYSNRWGDYSSMQIDPSDGCTFWYTGEYYRTSTRWRWTTRIGTFTFPTC